MISSRGCEMSASLEKPFEVTIPIVKGLYVV